MITSRHVAEVSAELNEYLDRLHGTLLSHTQTSAVQAIFAPMLTSALDRLDSLARVAELERAGMLSALIDELTAMWNALALDELREINKDEVAFARLKMREALTRIKGAFAVDTEKLDGAYRIKFAELDAALNLEMATTLSPIRLKNALEIASAKGEHKVDLTIKEGDYKVRREQLRGQHSIDLAELRAEDTRAVALIDINAMREAAELDKLFILLEANKDAELIAETSALRVISLFNEMAIELNRIHEQSGLTVAYIGEMSDLEVNYIIASALVQVHLALLRAGLTVEFLLEKAANDAANSLKIAELEAHLIRADGDANAAHRVTMAGINLSGRMTADGIEIASLNGETGIYINNEINVSQARIAALMAENSLKILQSGEETAIKIQFSTEKNTQLIGEYYDRRDIGLREDAIRLADYGTLKSQEIEGSVKMLEHTAKQTYDSIRAIADANYLMNRAFARTQADVSEYVADYEIGLASFASNVHSVSRVNIAMSGKHRLNVTHRVGIKGKNVPYSIVNMGGYTPWSLSSVPNIKSPMGGLGSRLTPPSISVFSDPKEINFD